MMRNPWLIAIVMAILVIAPARAQDAAPPAVTLTAQAGFGQAYRPDFWTPISVNLSNSGGPVDGLLTIRPQTSDAVAHAASAPVSLAEGARQTVTLYATLQAGQTLIRVDLIDRLSGGLIASTTTPLASIGANRLLTLVITASATGSIDLSGATPSVTQTNASLAALADRAGALDALDVIALADVDTGALSRGQRDVLAAWVAAGGHLVVVGGAGALATTAGLPDLLPLQPRQIGASAGLTPLAAWLRGGSEAEGFADETALALGTLHPSARVLVADAAGQPLIARRAYGNGTVDLLAFDPNAAPLRGWAGLPALWAALLTSTAPALPWGLGFINWGELEQAIAIIPGFQALPDPLPLVALLILYVLVIGPANYFVLARLKRREWAWFTVPVVIVLFTGLAYALGASWRGSTRYVSRLAVVRAWPGAETARVDAALGLISPGRETYALALAGETPLRQAMLRPLPDGDSNLFSVSFVEERNFAATIRQGAEFTVTDVAIDASFAAAFAASGLADAPAIAGSITITNNGGFSRAVRGFVRNDADFTLNDPVILLRSGALPLDGPLVPGGSLDFADDDTVNGGLAAAARRTGNSDRYFGGNTSYINIYDILGSAAATQSLQFRRGRVTPELLEQNRRSLLINGLVDEPSQTDQRGDSAFLVGWADAVPFGLDLGGAPWAASDRAFYIIALDVEQRDSRNDVLLSPDRYTWQRVGESFFAASPEITRLSAGESAALRFTPLPGANLSAPRLLTVSARTNTSGNTVSADLWNWQTGAWVPIEIEQGAFRELSPAPYLGPEGAVLLRFTADERTSFLNVEDIAVWVRGRP